MSPHPCSELMMGELPTAYMYNNYVLCGSIILLAQRCLVGITQSSVDHLLNYGVSVPC